MRQVKFLLIAVLGIALGLIIGQNTGSIQGHFLWFSVDIPAILLFLLTSSVSFILGLLMPIFTRKKKKIEPETQKGPEDSAG